MKIIKKIGRKWKGDNVFFIKTNREEAFSMDKLFILINQLALNEFNGFKEKGFLDKNLPFYFEEAINEVINFGKEGIDLLDNKNDSIAEKFCFTYRLPYTKWKQSTLEEF